MEETEETAQVKSKRCNKGNATDAYSFVLHALRARQSRDVFAHTHLVVVLCLKV